MAKQEVIHQSLMISPDPLSTVGILRETMKLPARNGKLMLRVILLIFSPFFLLVLLHNLTASPLLHKLEDTYEQSSFLDEKDVRSLLGLELLFFSAFSMVSLCGMMLTIHASSSVYLGKHAGLNDLILSVCFSWKNPLITWSYICFFSAIYVVLVIIMIKLISLFSSYYYAWGWVVGILAAIFYLYLYAQFALAFVVSVMEDGCCGRKAIRRGWMLMAGGREVQGFILMLILVVISCPIYVVFIVTLTDDDDELGPCTQFVFGLAASLLLCIANAFIFVVFTVFFYECKQSHGEKVEIMRSEDGYSLVSLGN